MMGRSDSEPDPFQKLPLKLIEGFLQRAGLDAERVIKELERDAGLVELVRQSVKPVPLQPRKAFKRVAAVDGSHAPAAAVSVGVAIAVISAGYIVYGEKVEYDYRADSVIGRLNDEVFKAQVRIEMRLLERKMALAALRQDPDVLIIDGGFVTLFPRRLYYGLPPHVQEEFREMNEITRELAESGKAVAIIKRSCLTAIEAELLLRGVLSAEDMKHTAVVRDKYLLAHVMPERSLWKYEGFTEFDPVILTRVLQRAISSGLDRFEEIAEREEERIAEARKELGIPQLNLRRAYIRTSAETPPFEVEYPATADIARVAERLLPLSSPETGFPIPFDLIDREVGLNNEVMRAYKQEVLVRALLNAKDKKALQVLLTQLNPQKEI